MKIAITGGTGFIGRKLVIHHLEQGHEVRVLSRRPSDSKDLSASVLWFHGDLSATLELQSFVDCADVLYHCAGELSDETRMKEVHVEGTKRLIRAAVGRVRRWVQLSSVGAYGKKLEGVITEGYFEKLGFLFKVKAREKFERNADIERKDNFSR